MRYLILAQSNETAAALAAWRDLLGYPDAYGTWSCPEPIVFTPPGDQADSGVAAYEAITAQVERLARCDEPMIPLVRVVVLVDGVYPSAMTAVGGQQTWSHLIALLVLTFPEVRWVFGLVSGDSTGFPAAEHSLPALLANPSRDPLLDPTGLRNWVRERTNVSLQAMRKSAGSGAADLPLRPERAAVIDDEKSYAYYHAYAAYRYGFRGEVVTSWGGMRELFAARPGGHGYQLLLEDFQLDFPDKPADTHLEKLRTDRASNCKALSNANDTARWRFLITTGQTQADKQLLADNDAYLREKRGARPAGGAHDWVRYKPMGGLLDMWEQLGLTRELTGPARGRAGNADGFVYPQTGPADPGTEGHGVPGKLALVADQLLRRAVLVRSAGATAQEFVRGAVLATDAAELLNGRIPETTLDGITLRHELEVRAELEFRGAGYHIGTDRRLTEFADEVDAVVRRVHQDNRLRLSLNTRITTLGRLDKLVGAVGQIEEQEKYAVAFRTAHRRISRPPVRPPRVWTRDVVSVYAEWLMSWTKHVVMVYAEWLLGSFSRLFLMSLLFVLAAALAGTRLTHGAISEVQAVGRASGWFFGGSAESSDDVLLVLVSCASAAGGAFHVGVLISYLFSVMARK